MPSSKFTLVLAAVLAAILVPAACTQEPGDSGDSPYEGVTAELCEAHTDAESRLCGFTTDDGADYAVDPCRAKWAERPDTTYRVALYYRRAVTAATSGKPRAEVVRADGVLTVPPREVKADAKPKTDPVGFESLWLARTGRYLNLSILISAGYTADNKGSHLISLDDLGTTTSADGRRTAHWRLGHDAQGLPAYFTVKAYISVPLAGIAADSATIELPTASGPLTLHTPLRP